MAVFSEKKLFHARGMQILTHAQSASATAATLLYSHHFLHAHTSALAEITFQSMMSHIAFTYSARRLR